MSKRRKYVVGLIVITIMLIYILWTQYTGENAIHLMSVFATMILALYFSVKRIEMFYLLKKEEGSEVSSGFWNYMGDMDFVSLAPHVVFPLPIIKPFADKQKNDVRLLINGLTVLFYVSWLSFFIGAAHL